MTRRCIESIRRLTPEEHEIILVDNASTDGTVEYLKSQSDLRLIENKENLGFAKGCNQGAAIATGMNLLFLNNDTVVTEDWLKNMLQVLYSHEKVGMVGPTSNSAGGPQTVQGNYNYRDSSLPGLDDFSCEHRYKHANLAIPCRRLVGFCLLIKRRVWDEVGSFDERFGIGNFEDDDLCLRILNAGYMLMIAFDSFLHHEGHATFHVLKDVNFQQLLDENQKKAREKWGEDIYTLLYRQRITISLCMIVKNEETTIKQCLDSIKDVMDEIVIVDTGSTDRTKQIAAEYTDRIMDFEWADDFSQARNFVFSQATKDYIMWLDADDVLLEEDRKKLLALKQTLDPKYDSISMIYHYSLDEDGKPAYSFRRNRIVKRSKNFRWFGAIHEYLEVNGNTLNSDIVITHKRIHSGTDRNLRIFEKMLAQGVEFSPRDLYYYANELRDHGKLDKAIEYYEKFLATKEGWVEDEITACYKLAWVYRQLGILGMEMYYLLKSFEYDTPRAEFCCRIGFQYYEKQGYKRAEFWYKLATQLERPKDQWGRTYEECWTWLPHLQLCVCYYHLGDNEKAYNHNEIARSYKPDDERVLFNKKFFEDLFEKQGKKIFPNGIRRMETAEKRLHGSI